MFAIVERFTACGLEIRRLDSHMLYTGTRYCRSMM